MKKLVLAFLFSLFLGTGLALAGGGVEDGPEQRSVPQTKVFVDVNVPDDGNNWVGPAIGATGAVIVAALGLLEVRRRSRKED